MDQKPPSKNLIFNADFLHLLGAFHGTWSSIDLTVDCALGKLLRQSPEETHILTSGMEFGRKARLLIELLKRSDHKKKSELIGVLNKLRNQPKRNAFAHSYIVSNPQSVTFIERSAGSDYKVKTHRYTLSQFAQHCLGFGKLGVEFGTAVEISDQELHDFAMAALRAVKS